MGRQPLNRLACGVGLSLTVSLALMACQRSTPPAKPTGPGSGTNKVEKDAAGASREQKQRELAALLQDAEDLFNRGENDLACDRVARADALSGSLSVAATNSQEQFKAACNQQ